MRRLPGVSLGLLLFSTAGLAGQDVGTSVPYTRFTLPNGLNVILHEDHTTPMVSVNVWYHVSSGVRLLSIEDVLGKPPKLEDR